MPLIIVYKILYFTLYVLHFSFYLSMVSLNLLYSKTVISSRCFFVLGVNIFDQPIIVIKIIAAPTTILYHPKTEKS